MAELRKIARRGVQSNFTSATPQAGSAFAMLAEASQAAYEFLEPAATAQMEREGAEAGREYARSQEGQGRVPDAQNPRPTQDGGLGRVGEAPTSTGAGVPPVSTTTLGGSQEEFISGLMPAAVRASERTGVDPRIIVAQAALESGWGASAPGNNFFGIKSHGQAGGQNLNTTEVINGQTVSVNDSFRQYGSADESVDGYADFLLNNPRYQNMMQAQGLEAQVAALGASGYATDPNYANKIMSIASAMPEPSAPISVSEDGSITGGDFDHVDVSSIIGEQSPTEVVSTRTAPQQAAQDAAVPAPQPQAAPEPEATVRTADGRLEPRLYSPMSGPIRQAHNAAFGIAYLSEKNLSGMRDMMDMSVQFQSDPEGFLQATRDYIDAATETAPREFREDLRNTLTTESQRRYLGMVDAQQQETQQRANNSSRALVERYTDDYAQALASGRSQDADAARQQLEQVLYARESLPGVSWTREQSENVLLGAMDASDRIRSDAEKAQSDAWKDQFDTIISAANDNRTSEFDNLLDNPSAVAAHPELAREAAAMMMVRDSAPDFMTATPGQQAAAIAEENARPIGAEWEQDVVDAMGAMHKRTVDGLEKDPIGYMEGNTQLPPPPIDLSMAATDQQGFLAALTARREYANGIREAGYVDFPAFLSDAEVETWSGLLGSDQPAEQRAALAAVVVQGFGEDAVHVFNELDADPVTKFGGQLLAVGGPMATVTEAMRGQELLNANQIQLPTNSGKIASFAPSAARAMEGLPNVGAAQEQITKFAQALYASKAQGIDPSSDEAKTLMEQSVQTAMGQATTRRGDLTGGVQEIYGADVLMPVGVSGRALSNAIDATFPRVDGGLIGNTMTALGGVAGADLGASEFDPTAWQEASPNGAIPMFGSEPISQELFSSGNVRMVAAGGNMYRMEVVTGSSVHDITTENGMVFFFDMKALIGE